MQNDSTGEKMMVDAGPAEDDQWGSTYHNPIGVKEEQKLEYALMQHGVRPEEITAVILTHLHWDHAYGVLKLPQAKVYVQKEELRYAVSPLPRDSKHYELNIKSQLPFFLQFFSPDAVAKRRLHNCIRSRGCGVTGTFAWFSGRGDSDKKRTISDCRRFD